MLPGPTKEECPCGCGLFGTPRFGPARHVRGCSCPRCRGRRSRRSGLTAQRKHAQALGIPRVGPMRPGDEEHWSGTVRVECKSGKTAAGPVLTKFLASEAQSEAHRPFGDHRPFVATFEHEGVAVVAFRLDRLREVIASLVEGLE